MPAAFPARRRLAVAIAASMLAAGCGSGASAAPSGPPGGLGPGPSASTPAGSEPPEAAQPSRVAPPAGLLAGLEGGAAEGALGSWTMDGEGSDSPWLPAAALHELQAKAGARFTVSLTDNVLIGAWSARAAAADDPAAEQSIDLGGRESPDPSASTISPDPLPAGTWVLEVRLFRADGRGNALFYWLIRVS